MSDQRAPGRPPTRRGLRPPGVPEAQPSAIGAAPPSGTGPRAAVAARPGLDPVGAVVAAVAAYAVAVAPFATLKMNRLAAGKGVALWAALPPSAAAAAVALLLAAAVAAVLPARPAVRIGIAAAALAAAAAALAVAAGHLIPPGRTFARVAPGSGFWLAAFAFAMLLADGVARLRPSPPARLASLAAAWLVVLAALWSGFWDNLSVMREYATHADEFWREAAKHVELAFGSLLGAVAVGIPLGVGCHRSAALRAATLPALNVVQTVPSIAMYGLMMVPLGLLAARIPILSELGIRGIGTAPALIALFLYSLLPVVANTAIGLDGVPAATVEAARGMGLSARQRLLAVEVPLAAPVVLTGIRIVLVQNIGLVTVAALIGGGGFGSFVFQGIGQAAIDLVLLGAVPTIALAFTAATVLDALSDLAGAEPR